MRGRDPASAEGTVPHCQRWLPIAGRFPTRCQWNNACGECRSSANGVIDTISCNALPAVRRPHVDHRRGTVPAWPGGSGRGRSLPSDDGRGGPRRSRDSGRNGRPAQARGEARRLPFVACAALLVWVAIASLAGCAVRSDGSGVSRVGIGLWGFGDPPGVNWHLDGPRRDAPQRPPARRPEFVSPSPPPVAPTPASAATAAAAGTATDSAPAAPEPPVRYRVIVEAPSPVSEAVAASGDLIRWQDYADMTRDLLHR